MGKKPEFETLETIVFTLIGMRHNSRYANKITFVRHMVKKANITRGAVYKALSLLKESGILKEKKGFIFGLEGDGRNRYVTTLEIDIEEARKRRDNLILDEYMKRDSFSKLPEEIQNRLKNNLTGMQKLWRYGEMAESMILIEAYGNGNLSESIRNYTLINDFETVMDYLQKWKKR